MNDITKPLEEPRIGEHQKYTGTIDEASEVLGTGRNQTYEAARRGDIPTIRMGKRILVLWQPFMRMLEGSA